MEIVKGETATFEGTAYSYWTGVASTSTVADITGATIKTYIKRNINDADNAAVITITGTIVTPAAGLFRSTLLASDTNGLTEITDKPVDWYFEHVVKLSDLTTYIRSGVQFLTILPNVGKTLF
jgi:hypothetical protein